MRVEGFSKRRETKKSEKGGKLVIGRTNINQGDIMPDPMGNNTLYFTDYLQNAVFNEMGNRFKQLYSSIVQWTTQRIQEELLEIWRENSIAPVTLSPMQPPYPSGLLPLHSHQLLLPLPEPLRRGQRPQSQTDIACTLAGQSTPRSQDAKLLF